MPNTLLVRLTPWAADRIRRDYCKSDRLTKTALRASLRDMPDTEFHTVATPTMRGGAVVTTREAYAHDGTDTLEVYDGDRLLAVVVTGHDGQSVVR